MKKLFLLILTTVLLCQNTYAIDINSYTDITIGTDIVSKYMYRGHCIAHENIQPYVDFNFGNDTIGVFTLEPWFSVGRDEENKLYRELNFTASYVVPKDYFGVSIRYLYYLDMYEKEENHELQLGCFVSLSDICPLTFVLGTSVIGTEKYNINTTIQYNATYRKWEFIPLFGYNFLMIDKYYYPYISFDATRYFDLSDLVTMYTSGGITVNFFDYKNFEYGKNANVYISCGFEL